MKLSRIGIVLLVSTSAFGASHVWKPADAMRVFVHDLLWQQDAKGFRNLSERSRADGMRRLRRNVRSDPKENMPFARQCNARFRYNIHLGLPIQPTCRLRLSLSNRVAMPTLMTASNQQNEHFHRV
jgi:hypothetical protein